MTDNEIALEAKKRYPYNEKESENRINKLSSKRRHFIEGAKFIRDLKNNTIKKQLDEWIDSCEIQADLFFTHKMEVSEASSMAMAQAYKNVKQILEKEYEKKH